MLDHLSNAPQGTQSDVSDHLPSQRRAQPRIDSRRLLAGGCELVIDHAGQEYRLRLTRNDKLILTK
jgi:hemin uptake protein HemP